MAENVTIEFRTRGLARTIREFQKLESGIARIDLAARKLRSVGRRLSTFVTLPLIAAGGAALKLASDAEEVGNKFDVVMGPASRAIRQELEALTETMPATRAELEAAAAGIQDLLVPMGVARREAAGMSAEMVKLAGDLASFNNVPVEVALEAMKSSLAGMSRPMRQFGVDTTVAALETVALREGLIEAGEEMDRTARAQAILIKIQEDSADAMGDAARTADSTANSLKFLKRDIKAVGEELGKVLIPVARDAAQGLSRMLQTITDLDEDMQKLVVGLVAVTAAAGPLLLILSQLTIAITSTVSAIAAAGGLTAALSGIGAVLTGPAGIIALLGAAGLVGVLMKVADTMRDDTLPATTALKEEMDKLVDSTEDLTAAQVDQQLTRTATQFASLQGQITAVDEEIKKLQRDFSGSEAGGRLGLGLGQFRDIEVLRQQKEALARRADIFRETIRELQSIQAQLRSGPGPAGEPGAGPTAADATFGAAVGLGPGGGAQLMGAAATLGRGETPILTGAGTVMVNTLADMEEASVSASESIQGLVTVTDSGFATVANTAISSMGAAVQAAITGFDNIARVVINTVTQVMQALAQQGGPLGGILGGLGVPIFGAIGGILGAIVGGGSDRPQPVEVKNRDPIPVEDQRDRGPSTIVLNLRNAAGEVTERLQYDLRRRERRDAVQRIPTDVNLGLASG